MDIEYRFTALPKADLQIEQRKHTDKDKDKDYNRIGGYASVFYDPLDPGTEYMLAPDIFERIMPSAFENVKEYDVVALFNHDDNLLLGRTSSGTLKLSVDKIGLRYDVDLPDTTLARDIKTLMQRGDLKGSSFAFMITDQEFIDEGSRIVREIRGVELIDVSVVTTPAYTSSSSYLRSKADELISLRSDSQEKGDECDGDCDDCDCDKEKRASYKGVEIDTSPTDGMVEEAERGLAWREEFGRGGTEVGVARARDISNRRNLSLSTVKRMFSFFSRHEVDKEAEGFRPGEDGFPSNGRIAWALWGGDSGFAFSRSITEKLDKIDEEDRSDDSDSSSSESASIDTSEPPALPKDVVVATARRKGLLAHEGDA